MVVQLVINEEMIDCFHSCTQKGNYGPLFNNHDSFFRCLVENIRKVKFLGTSFSRDISDNLPYMFDNVINFNPNRRAIYNVKNRVTVLFENLDEALVSSNWSNFYWKYRQLIDSMIKAARFQGVMDLRIAKGSMMYETFGKRDQAIYLEANDNAFGVNPIFKSSHSPNVENVSSQPNYENVPNKIPEVKQSVSSDMPDAYELDFTSAPEVEGLVPAGVPQVKQSFPSEIPIGYEFGFTNEPETKEPISHKTPEVEQLGSASVPGVASELENLQENLQANQQETIIQLESTVQAIIEKVDLIQIELHKKQELDIMEENLKSMKKNLEAYFDKQLSDTNILLNKKFHELSSRNQEIDEKTEKAINLIQNDMKNITQKQLEMEHTAKQTVDASIAALKAELMDKMNLIEKNVEEQRDQLKLKEDLLNKKIVDMIIREDSLNNKMKAKEEALDRKIEEVKVKEEVLEKEINAMLKLMELFEQQNQPKVVVTHCSENSERCDNGSDIESTDRFQAKEEATEHPRSCPSTSNSKSLSIEDLLDDDDEIRKMKEAFKKQEAEQLRRNDAELVQLQERGRQRNEKNQGEIRELARSVSRAGERASFRQ